MLLVNREWCQWNTEVLVVNTRFSPASQCFKGSRESLLTMNKIGLAINEDLKKKAEHPTCVPPLMQVVARSLASGTTKLSALYLVNLKAYVSLPVFKSFWSPKPTHLIHRIFNYNEIGLYCKRMSSRPHPISEEETTPQGIKSGKVQQTDAGCVWQWRFSIFIIIFNIFIYCNTFIIIIVVSMSVLVAVFPRFWVLCPNLIFS